MELKPSELEYKGYVLEDTLDHRELIPFIQKYNKKLTFYSIFYKAANILLAIGIVIWFMAYSQEEGVNFEKSLGHLSYGFLMALLLIPIHEYIHALAYRSQGAKNTSYDVHWKKFYFMAVADQFVANQKEFTVVALAPFVVISSVLLLILPWVSVLWALSVLSILLSHTAFCSGDFGLLSYFASQKDKEIVTFDDKNAKISYFYAKPKNRA